MACRLIGAKPLSEPMPAQNSLAPLVCSTVSQRDFAMLSVLHAGPIMINPVIYFFCCMLRLKTWQNLIMYLTDWDPVEGITPTAFLSMGLVISWYMKAYLWNYLEKAPASARDPDKPGASWNAMTWISMFTYRRWGLSTWQPLLELLYGYPRIVFNSLLLPGRLCTGRFLLSTPISRLECNENVSDDNNVIMGAMASQITGVSVVNSIVYSGSNQRKHQSSASLAFVRGIHRWPVNSVHKWPVTRKMFPFNNVIMKIVIPEWWPPGDIVHSQQSWLTIHPEQCAHGSNCCVLCGQEPGGQFYSYPSGLLHWNWDIRLHDLRKNMGKRITQIHTDMTVYTTH